LRMAWLFCSSAVRSPIVCPALSIAWLTAWTSSMGDGEHGGIRSGPLRGRPRLMRASPWSGRSSAPPRSRGRRRRGSRGSRPGPDATWTGEAGHRRRRGPTRACARDSCRSRGVGRCRGERFSRHDIRGLAQRRSPGEDVWPASESRWGGGTPSLPHNPDGISPMNEPTRARRVRCARRR
jgi:hypothetical protein